MVGALFVFWLWCVVVSGVTSPTATVEAEKEVVQPAVTVEEIVER